MYREGRWVGMWEGREVGCVGWWGCIGRVGGGDLGCVGSVGVWEVGGGDLGWVGCLGMGFRICREYADMGKLGVGI